MILWDIIDNASSTDNSPNIDDDYINDRFDLIFDTLNRSQPQTILEFYDKWLLLSNEHKELKNELYQIYRQNGLKKSKELPQYYFDSSPLTGVRFIARQSGPYNNWPTFHHDLRRTGYTTLEGDLNYPYAHDVGVSLSGGHPGSTTYGDEVRAWSFRVSGDILINSTIYDANPSCGDGITYIIKKNSEPLFNNSYPNNFTSTNVQAMVNVNKGDMLYFRINRGADNSCDSTTELVKIYAMSNAKDYAQGNNGNVYNATWSSSSGYNGLGAYDYNGASSYINAGDIDYMDTSPTLSGCEWVYHDTSNNDDTIFKKSVAQTEGIIFYRQNFQTATGKSDVYGIFVADSVDTSSALLTSANLSSQLNNWTYVCFTYLEGSSTGLRLYVNGIEAPDSPASV